MRRLAKASHKFGWYRNGVDDIMRKLGLGRYRARDVWDIMQENKVSMDEAYNIFIRQKDIDDI